MSYRLVSHDTFREMVRVLSQRPASEVIHLLVELLSCEEGWESQTVEGVRHVYPVGTTIPQEAFQAMGDAFRPRPAQS